MACDGQLASITQKLARERAIGDIQLGPTFSAVMGKVSVAALQGAYTKNLSLKLGRDCQGFWRTTIGYSCAHNFQLCATNC